MKISLPTKDILINLDDIAIERGIFQEDSFSPLIFCITIALLSWILRCGKTGFETIKYNASYLNYMDNLTIYAKNRDEMKICIEIVKNQ